MATPSPTPEQPIRLVPQTEARPAAPAANPAIVALPSFVVGTVTLGMGLVGVVPATASGAAMPVIIAAAVGMFVATIWSARIGENAAAGIYSIFGGLFLSYALLVLGLTHNWYGIALTAMADTQKMFVISWIVVVSMLVLAAIRMPVIYLLLFAAVDVSLVLNLLGIIQTSSTLDKAAGWVLMGVAAIIVYLFVGAASHSTGGRELPLGPALMHA